MTPLLRSFVFGMFHSDSERMAQREPLPSLPPDDLEPLSDFRAGTSRANPLERQVTGQAARFTQAAVNHALEHQPVLLIDVHVMLMEAVPILCGSLPCLLREHEVSARSQRTNHRPEGERRIPRMIESIPAPDDFECAFATGVRKRLGLQGKAFVFRSLEESIEVDEPLIDVCQRINCCQDDAY